MRWENKAMAGRQLISDSASRDKRDRRSSYADQVGKYPGEEGGTTEVRRAEEKVKKKEKAASKRPPSSIHSLFQRVLARFRIKRREHPLGPASA